MSPTAATFTTPGGGGGRWWSLSSWTSWWWWTSSSCSTSWSWCTSRGAGRAGARRAGGARRLGRHDELGRRGGGLAAVVVGAVVVGGADAERELASGRHGARDGDLDPGVAVHRADRRDGVAPARRSVVVRDAGLGPGVVVHEGDVTARRTLAVGLVGDVNAQDCVLHSARERGEVEPEKDLSHRGSVDDDARPCRSSWPACCCRRTSPPPASTSWWRPATPRRSPRWQPASRSPPATRSCPPLPQHRPFVRPCTAMASDFRTADPGLPGNPVNSPSRLSPAICILAER